MQKHSYLPIFSLQLAGWLMQRGFILHYCQRNVNNPAYIVYYFVKGEAISKAISEYTSSH